ncbi:MAG: phosphoribosylglycinamide formyltransferase [Bacilli bacterium]|jgi:phosphoribosylglycinamide formyltransferase-1|nr:phosphoribosylglycinamide formyltransferase [Bacilli bacterium]
MVSRRNTIKKRALRMAIFASGTGTNFKNIVDASLALKINAQVMVLVCNKKYAKALNLAKHHNIPTIIIDYDNINKEELEHNLLKELAKYHLDLICLAGFMRKLSPLFVKTYHNKIINVHPSLLPKYRGLKAMERAYEAKEEKMGATVHFVDDGLDTGSIIIQEAFKVGNRTLEEAIAKTHEIEYRIYLEAINIIEGEN